MEEVQVVQQQNEQVDLQEQVTKLEDLLAKSQKEQKLLQAEIEMLENRRVGMNRIRQVEREAAEERAKHQQVESALRGNVRFWKDRATLLDRVEPTLIQAKILIEHMESLVGLVGKAVAAVDNMKTPLANIMSTLGDIGTPPQEPQEPEER